MKKNAVKVVSKGIALMVKIMTTMEILIAMTKAVVISRLVILFQIRL
jgi:hypothetical protein